MRQLQVSVALMVMATMPLVTCAQVQVKLFKGYTQSEKDELRCEFERIEELLPDQQAGAVPRVYRDLFQFFLWDYGNHAVDHRGPLHQRCCSVLAKHRRVVATLIVADLRAGDPNLVRHALDMAGSLQLGESYEAIAAFFAQHDGERAAEAAQALGRIGDQRAVRLLMEKEPRDPMRYSGALSPLCRNRPADAAVLHCLRTGDAPTRRGAAYALSESKDPALVPDVARLCRDPDPEVRLTGARMGLAMTGEAYEWSRNAVASLLADPDVEVRMNVAIWLAHRKDAASARPLLELLRTVPLTESQHLEVVGAVAYLTGIRFDHGNGPNGWKLTTPKNQEILRRFATWVAQREGKQS